MTWRYNLNLKDIWTEMKDPDSDCTKHLGHFGKEIAARIRKAPFYGDFEDQSQLERICESFERLDENSEDSDFNYLFNQLYDWGDRDRRVWIATSL